MRLRPSRDMETNIGILAGNKDSLWKYRNLLDCFEKETGYKLSMTLMMDWITAYRGMTFNQGGYDILILAEHRAETEDAELIESLLGKKESLIVLRLCSSPEPDGHIPGVIDVPDWDAMEQILKEKIGSLRKEYQTNRKLKGVKP